MMSSGHTCAVINCYNNSVKLQQWKKKVCEKHKPMLHEDCPCKVPYSLHRFPGRPEDLQVRKAWVRNINRKDFVPGQYSRVCGIHFVDGRPTKAHPYPVLHLGYKNRLSKVTSVPTVRRRKCFPPLNVNATTMCNAGTQWPDLEDHNYFTTNSTKNCATQTDPAPSFSAYDLDNSVTEQNLHLLEHDYLQLQQEEDYERVYVKQEAEPETPYIKEEEQEGEINNFPMTFNVKIEEDEGPSGAAQPWSNGSFQHSTTKDVTKENLHPMNQDPPHVKEEDEFEMVYIKQETEPETPYIEEKQEHTNFPITVSVKIVEDEGPSDDSGAENLLNYSSFQHLTSKGEGQSQLDGLSDSDEVTSHSSATDTDIEGAYQNASKCLNKSTSKRKTKQHVGAKPFACSFCCKRFRRKQQLTSHTRVHNGEKPFVCTHCGKRFTHNRDLKRHIRTHTGEKSLACSFCERKFGRKQQLTIHTRIHTGENLFLCTICGKRFTRKVSLNLHKITHTEKKPLACSFCDKRFGRKKRLTTHTCTHNGEKRFSCTFCGESFIRKQLLTTHMKTHTGEKPFPRTTRGKRVTEKESLKKRRRTHTGEKLFACSFCDKRFYFKCRLTKHTRVHTGEKPFVCSLCGERFARKGDLVSHTRKHTEETPFNCDV
ncbi:zinc finger protein 25-like [Corythoichthys intestinalis]|uniref:zinc finger protein 25-like n=1 Tax=Corythoichthys intestinalis TaxID=161448 RepID=UPI0025A57F2D|nr:zinc finger protein 25-like [Corythoichthys intestinalis]